MDEVDLDLIRDMLRYSEVAIRLLGTMDSAEFKGDDRTFLAVWQALQIVGAAASKISRTTQRDLPSVPWSKVIGMRHHLVHGYRRCGRKSSPRPFAKTFRRLSVP
jgi:uncharacterized protein with HEPN domain